MARVNRAVELLAQGQPVISWENNQWAIIASSLRWAKPLRWMLHWTVQHPVADDFIMCVHRRR